jgi:hypothetical protein
MSAHIHLIGLNAQVQAARAVHDLRGAGLEVLSARTSEISDETNRISEQAAGQLDALAAGLAESVRAFGQLRTNGITHQNSLNEQGRKEEEQLHAFRDSALEVLREIGTSFDDITAQARRTLETIQFAQFHQVTIPALRSPLAAIAEAAERWLQAQGCGVAEECLVDGFKREYTMAGEHEVFASIMEPRPPSRRLPEGTDEIPGANINSGAELPVIAAGTPLLLEEPKVDPSPANSVQTGGGAGALGDNVELF